MTSDDEPIRELHPDLAAAIAETRAALEGLTGEARRKRAAGLRFRGAGHAIGAVPDLPPDLERSEARSLGSPRQYAQSSDRRIRVERSVSEAGKRSARWRP